MAYRSDTRLEHAVKMFRALAFVPPEEVQEFFDSFVKSEKHDERLNQFADVYLRVSYEKFNF